ncbi:hypothetical protein [Microbacterium hatanonis]|uniref:Uncharacterized protein n=1 Tax=Microbacterium hatanonis TaxID=404366 RepID=A0A5C8I5R3_9MICO|nr:hypothetical protein [Microbacterium hatanonis]TXK13213.1 hypothetical protein FVP77_07290 [Microbacterium hatanonis]
MTVITASRRVARATPLDRLLSAAAHALDAYVSARQRRRLDSLELHGRRRAATEAQRDRVGAVAMQLMPR